MASGDAQRRFEAENNVQSVDADSIYSFDGDAQKKLREQKPWAKECGDTSLSHTAPLPLPSLSSTLCPLILRASAHAASPTLKSRAHARLWCIRLPLPCITASLGLA